ncbi:hypothetical protein EU244_027880 [Rhodococcus qingshengii]|nr:hypothetical protein [Rhodococcus qingshengii]
MSFAGLLAIMTLADQTRPTELLAAKVAITAPKIASGAGGTWHSK